MSSSTHQRETVSCRNCTYAITKTWRFCPACGQDTAPHPPSAFEFVHEFISHYIAFEGRLWRTLGLLFFKPGQLTKEYLAGRKLRYVLPLRLYLTISLIFFIALGFSGNVATNTSFNDASVKEELQKGQNIRIGFGLWEAKLNKDGSFECNMPDWACNRLRGKVERMKQSPQAEFTALTKRFSDDWPYAMFILMPVFALLLKLVYWKRRMVYGEHMVFTFHVHAAWFVLALLTLFLPDSVNGIAIFLMPIYTVLAMKRVYGGRWWGALLRAVAISVPYLLGIVLVMALLAFYIALV